MKLFLCGGGSGKQILPALQEFAKIIDKKKPMLYIPLAMASEKYDSCYDWFREEMKLINISDFEMVKSSLELSQKDFADYSSVFIGGGNTYKLLKELKDNNNFQKIRNYLINGGIIFGSSAGAIIFGNDIDSCLLDDNKLFVNQDTSGFNYLNNYSLLCHYNPTSLEKRKSYLSEYSLKYKTIYLPEDTVIYINDNGVSLIDNSIYVIIKNGKFIYHNSLSL